MNKKNPANHLVEYQKKRSAEARKKVFEYFKENPFHNAKECSDNINIPYGTVARYVREFKKQQDL